MSCEVAYLSFQANANYGTCSIDFGLIELKQNHSKVHFEESIQNLSFCTA